MIVQFEFELREVIRYVHTVIFSEWRVDFDEWLDLSVEGMCI